MFPSRCLAIFRRVHERHKLLTKHVKPTLIARNISSVKEHRHVSGISSDVSVGYVATDYANKVVFASKDTSELLRAFLILTASSVDWFVTYSDKILLQCRRILWQPMFDAILQKTFYGHFAAGSCIKTSEHAITRLKNNGIRAMLMVPIEAVNYNTEEEEEIGLQENFDIIKDCIHGEALVESHGFSQVKLTALCDKGLLLEMNKHLIQFETDHKEPAGWDVKEMCKYLEERRYEDVHIVELGENMNKKLQKLLENLDHLAELCRKNHVRLMVDAEQTYLQAALGYLVLLLQAKFNKEEPIVYNTYQCFRKDTLNRIKADHDLGERLGFKIAGKLVRGAYMLEERRLAKEGGYEDPINDTFEDTTNMYHSCVDYLLPMICEGDAGVMIASHNEDTVDFVKDRMTKFNLPKRSNYLCFGQIYGMCDHVSYHLAEEGYHPFKSVPYGSIDDTLLYLTRRAQENKSVMARTKLERQMIRKELARRVKNKFLSS